jgi:hypothetical protein
MIVVGGSARKHARNSQGNLSYVSIGSPHSQHPRLDNARLSSSSFDAEFDKAQSFVEIKLKAQT